MKTKNFLSFLVATIALVFLATLAIPAASAFATIEQIAVNGVEVNSPFSETVSVFAGDTISVRTRFLATDNGDNVTDVDEEVRVTARILGEPGTIVDTREFAVIENGTYSRLLTVELPLEIDEQLDENLVLEVNIESRTQGSIRQTINLHIQRESHFIEILSIESDDEAKAGEALLLDVVVKNRGRRQSEDTFVRASIPALGISKMSFLGDLSPIDQGGNVPDKEDSALARIFLNLPRDAPAGVYNVEIEAFNDDSATIATRKVVIVGGSADSDVISSRTSKTFAVGEEQEYTMTIVNADNRIKVYELILDSTSGLAVTLEESLVAVPAGNSRTVKFKAIANEEGTFNFAVNVHSDGELVDAQNFVANVEGRTTAVGNTAVVLTIILAIIFVVLLIVLIVLLTRKPEKTEEFGESYY